MFGKNADGNLFLSDGLNRFGLEIAHGRNGDAFYT